MAHFFFTSLILFYIISVMDASKLGGITMDLIARDSPLSPLRNPNATRFERFQNLFRRSIARKASLSMEAPTLVPSITNAEYITKISIGTPPVETVMIVDTGSDLVWTPCVPCMQCGPQNFDPSKSTSYKSLSCQSSTCNSQGTTFCGDDFNCKYHQSYRDESDSTGDLANDILSLRSSSGESVSSPLVFGCGHENREKIGIMGLGLGDLSIVNQLRNSFGGMFSYCFTQIDDESNPPSKLSFGSNALVSGPQVVSTPLIKRSDHLGDTNYYLNLKGITIGTKRFNLESFIFFNQGNIMIDSGTTSTFLPSQFYLELESELIKLMENSIVNLEGLFRLCFQTNGRNFTAPKIVFNFTDADLELSPTSTFLEVESGKFCFTMMPSEDRNIFGNLNQMNYLVGYDLVNGKVNFKKTDCSKFP